MYPKGLNAKYETINTVLTGMILINKQLGFNGDCGAAC